MQTKPTISVALCAFTEERWHTLVRAIESVRNQTIPPYEIVLIIDHNPELFERATMYTRDMPDVVVVENSFPLGLSGSRNSGVANARGEIIAFLDDDAVAEPDWLEQLLAGYAHKDVISVGGSIHPVWVDGRPPWFPDEFNWVYGCTYRGMPDYTYPVQRLIGCNMSFRRDVFATIGEFRNGYGRIGNFPIAGEETELFVRTTHILPDKVILYEPRAKVHHHMPASRANWRYFQSRCFAEGIAKSLLSRMVGLEQALAAEWGYTFLVLPQGVWRGIRETLRTGDTIHLARAGAIVAGLGITALGYAIGTVARVFGVSVVKKKK